MAIESKKIVTVGSYPGQILQELSDSDSRTADNFKIFAGNSGKKYEDIGGRTEHTTIAKIRAMGANGIPDANPNIQYLTKDYGSPGVWLVDETDITSIDNTGTILVTAGGIRVKRKYNGDIYPEWFGAVADGSTDDSTEINNALTFASTTTKKNIVLSGRYGSSSVINIPAGTTITSNNATIFALANAKVISLSPGSAIKGNLTINTYNIYSTFTEDCIYIDGSKTFNDFLTTIDSVYFKGRFNGQGTAIHFDCSAVGSQINRIQIGYVSINGYTTGIKMNASAVSTSTSNYCNACTINSGLISQCDTYIELSGNGSGGYKNYVSGNIFKNLQLQYSSRAVNIANIDALNNSLSGFIFDVPFDKTVFKLSSDSALNEVHILGSLIRSNYSDFGRMNIIENNSIEIINVAHKTPPYRATVQDNNYIGEYDDIFTNSNIVHNVSITQGAALITTGSINDIFKNYNDTLLNLDLSGSAIFEFEITFNTDVYPGFPYSYLFGGLRNLCFDFYGENKPNKIDITITNTSDVDTTTTIDLVTSPDNLILTRLNNNGFIDNIKKITVKLTGQQKSFVRFLRIYGSSYYLDGVSYLPTAGGKMAGNIIHSQEQITGTSIDFNSQRKQYVSLSSDTTYTASNEGDGKEIDVLFTNSDTSDHTITITGFTFGDGTSSFTVPASSSVLCKLTVINSVNVGWANIAIDVPTLDEVLTAGATSTQTPTVGGVKITSLLSKSYLGTDSDGNIIEATTPEPNYIKGGAVFDGDGTTTEFTVTYPTALSVAAAQITISADSEDAAKAQFYLSSSSILGFSITAAGTIPPTSTGNISINYVAYKS